jgi:hypothetical protein
VESFKDDLLAQLKAANVDAPVNECDEEQDLFGIDDDDDDMMFHSPNFAHDSFNQLLINVFLSIYFILGCSELNNTPYSNNIPTQIIAGFSAI